MGFLWSREVWTMIYNFYQEKNNLYPVSQDAVDAAIAHALEESPREACGVVINNVYYPVKNIHQYAKVDFAMDTNEYFSLVEKYGPLQAVIHSHPQGQTEPSGSDMQYQQTVAVPFGI